jgi:DNA-binding NtrC family response regulator
MRRLRERYEEHGYMRELDDVIQQLMVLANLATITPEAVVNLLGYTESRPKGSFRLPADELLVRDNDTMATWLRRAQHIFLTTVVAQYSDRTSAAKRLGLTKNALNLQLSRLRAHRDDTVQSSRRII